MRGRLERGGGEREGEGEVRGGVERERVRGRFRERGWGAEREGGGGS